MMSFNLGNGVKIESRVPMMICAAPDWASCQLCKRSLSLKLLCKLTSGKLAKRLLKRASNCGVKLISGTSTNIWAS